MKISIYSFGYKFSGIPKDKTGNCGGHIFDCRALKNPYHTPELKQFDGRSKEIQQFFSNDSSINHFLDLAYNLITFSSLRYIERGFDNLYVAFGCTGGYHRSVYCAESIKSRLLEKGFEVVLLHTELNN